MRDDILSANEETMKLIRTADRIHRFPAKMNPELALFFLERILVGMGVEETLRRVVRVEVTG